MKLFKLFVLLVVICSLVCPMQPALAAGCYGSTCHGKDPNQMSCSGYTVMRTIKQGTSGTVWNELRFSDSTSCYSNWTKESNYNNYVRHLLARLTQDNPPTYSVAEQEESSIYSYIWTNMETAANTWCAKGAQGYSNQAFDTYPDPTCG